MINKVLYLYKIDFTDNESFTTTNITSNSFPTANISSVSEGGSTDTLLVTFSNYGITSIWYSSNGGDSWIEKQSNLPDMPIRTSLIHPDNSNHALVGTEIGVWGTENLNDINTTWAPHNNGIANVRIDMLSIREEDHMILASTHGRGQFYGYYYIIADDIIGDINNDSYIDVIDVVLLVNIILENGLFIINADLNIDGIINVIDVVLLVNIILDN